MDLDLITLICPPLELSLGGTSAREFFEYDRFAAELRETGVQFLCVDPGDMDTAMHAAAIPDADRSQLQKPEDAARRILEIIRHAEAFPNGSRLVASELEVLQ